jgi:hypothetical protein
MKKPASSGLFHYPYLRETLAVLIMYLIAKDLFVGKINDQSVEQVNKNILLFHLIIKCFILIGVKIYLCTKPVKL